VSAQWSIVGSFATLATTLAHLRDFVGSTYASLSSPEPTSEPKTNTVLRPTAQRRPSRTLEALAEAIDIELRTLESWCAAREQALLAAQSGVGPPLVVSLLGLERDVATEFGGAFGPLLGVVRTIVRRAGGGDTTSTVSLAEALRALRTPPARLSSLALDALLFAAQERALLGETRAADALKRVFVRAAEPLWAATHAWLRDGMHVRAFVDAAAASLAAGNGALRTLDDEFFIEDNELGMLDPDFWAQGFVLRGDNDVYEDIGRATIPVFLKDVADLVLGAGKAVGLLRALGVSTVGDQYQNWVVSWKDFGVALGGSLSGCDHQVVSSEILPLLVHDYLAPQCKAIQARLAQVIVQDCDLDYHLHAVEDLFLMRRGDVMAQFADLLFARVCFIMFRPSKYKLTMTHH
jgi:gamma-tubulin complex component 5